MSFTQSESILRWKILYSFSKGKYSIRKELAFLVYESLLKSASILLKENCSLEEYSCSFKLFPPHPICDGMEMQ